MEENKNSKKIYTQDEAAWIVDIFEDLLEKHGILIPDEDREGREEEACIYGMTYGELLYDVEDRLISLLKSVGHENIVSREFSGGSYEVANNE